MILFILAKNLKRVQCWDLLLSLARWVLVSTGAHAVWRSASWARRLRGISPHHNSGVTLVQIWSCTRTAPDRDIEGSEAELMFMQPELGQAWSRKYIVFNKYCYYITSTITETQSKTCSRVPTCTLYTSKKWPPCAWAEQATKYPDNQGDDTHDTSKGNNNTTMRSLLAHKAFYLFNLYDLWN